MNLINVRVKLSILNWFQDDLQGCDTYCGRQYTVMEEIIIKDKKLEFSC